VARRQQPTYKYRTNGGKFKNSKDFFRPCRGYCAENYFLSLGLNNAILKAERSVDHLHHLVMSVVSLPQIVFKLIPDAALQINSELQMENVIM
jgi:hypothetical protein